LRAEPNATGAEDTTVGWCC